MKYPVLKVVFDRKHQASNTKKGLVQIEIYYLGKRKWIGTGIKLYTGQWKDRVMVHGRADALELNDQINNMVITIREWTNSLIKSGEPFSFEKLDYMLKYTSSEYSFIDFLEKRIAIRKMKGSTKLKYNVMFKAIKDFGLIKSFEDLTPSNIGKWNDYLNTKGISNTTIHDYHKRLKAIVGEAYQFECISKNPYNGFKVVRPDPTSRKYLTSEELSAVENADIENESVNNARDCFVFCCYTGLSYADLAKFDFNKDVVTKNKKFYIEDKRSKTENEYSLMILPPAMDILKKHDFKLPVISNQQYNKILKVVGMYAKINKSLTSHVARHTFATWTLSQGVRIETVSKMLAHTDIKTTQIYAKILQKEVDRAFESLEEGLKKR